MNPAELRIGNYVDFFGEVTIIDGLCPFNTGDQILKTDCCITQAGTTSFRDIEPIPLTEEWLERFGCMRQKISSLHRNYWNKDLDFSIDVEFTFDKDVLFFYRICGEKRRRPIPYVHQLQNLYFALTGEELKTKDHDTKTNPN